MSHWYRHTGAEGDVVVSTRVRLARNLGAYPFPAAMSAAQKRAFSLQLHDAMRGEPFTLYDMPDLPPRDALAMAERHLISPAFAAREEGTMLLLSADESVSIMVGEEDHLRLQVLRAGMALSEAWQTADALDDRLDERLSFAFDERLGYLTRCPTNLGTGMRASLMLHLPALEESGALRPLAATVSKLGLTIRGLYGEGSRPEGALYQLSNQVTLGIAEQAAIGNLSGIAAQIIRQERAARDARASQPAFIDRVWRSLGILQNARLLPRGECMTLLSHLREGVALGIVDTPPVTPDTLNALTVDTQPAGLMRAAGRDLTEGACDEARAELVRHTLKSV